MEQPPIKRPAGVWILSILIALGAGISPASIAVLALMRGGVLLEAMGGPVFAAISLAFAVGIVYVAVGAWRGQSAARYKLVIMAALYYAHYAWVQFQAATGGLVSPSRVPVHQGRALRGVLMVVVVVCYFLFNPHARRFYAAHSTLEPDAAPPTVEPPAHLPTP